MKIDISIREDLWKAIQAHYERNDYTEAVRDAVFHASEVLREKGGIEDKDGTKLVDAALLGNNPAILVSKNETTTEKDFQQGIGFAFKGIMQSVRNPLSHESFQYTQDEAEVLILYINFLLNQVDKSGGSTKIDNIIDLLFDEDFTDTQEYAELLLKEVPSKKRYDLLLELYQKSARLPQNKLKHFIAVLFASLTKAAKGDFVRIVSRSLMKCKDDTNLRMYCHYFMDDTYAEIDKLAQLRIEDLMLKSLNAGKYENVYDFENDTHEKKCTAGSLSTWINNKLDLLGNKEAIINLLFKKLDREYAEQEFVFKYFLSAITKKPSEYTKFELYVIKSQLKKGNSLFSNWLWEEIDMMADKEYINTFGAEYEECKKIIEEAKKQELPF